MRRWQKWAGLICAALLIALVSSCATMLELWDPNALQKSNSTLTARLGGQTWEASSKEFDRRVKARFPVGTAESTMTLELRRQGFRRQDWSYEKHDDDEATAFRSENNFVCNQGAFVYWRADAAGNITTIRGEYRELGCL